MPRSKNKAPPSLSCNSHDCPNHKHAYRPDDKDGNPTGCIGCGDMSVDFNRLYRLDIRDAPFTCQALRHELIRDEFWTRPFNDRAMNYALRKGMTELLALIPQKIVQHVGSVADSWEWQRVPIQDERIQNPYQYGYHATATCCRRCMRYWHGVPRDRELTSAEVTYFSGLMNRYLCQRLPNLPADPQKVPALRKHK